MALSKEHKRFDDIDDNDLQSLLKDLENQNTVKSDKNVRKYL